MLPIDFARVFEALPSPYMLLDRELRYVAANRAYLRATQSYSNFEQIRGRLVFDAFPAPDERGDRLRASLENVLATGESDTLAYLLYPIRRADGATYEGYWTAVHTPIFDRAGNVAFILQNTVDVTEFARLREQATLPFTSLNATTSLIERTREAESAAADFRRLFQQAPGFVAVMSGPQHIFTFTSDAYARLIGGRQVIGRPIREALPEVIEQGFVELLDTVYHEGKSHSAEGARITLANEPGKTEREHFLDFSYNPIRGTDGAITGVFVQGMDRTDAFRAQQRQRLLIDELNHRVKNALATVQSIAAQTLRSTSDTADARKAFEARIVALSKAHNMLSDRNWDDTELTRLVHQELIAYDAGQVQVRGPDLTLNAKATVALALLFHELTTNAAKHGALSSLSGRLLVDWHEAVNGNLTIEWSETGGPTVAPPTRRGFGTRMLNTVVTGELGGTLESHYEPGGFRAVLSIPPSAYQRTIDADAK
jgi:two-component sensor histidine kinase